ncbi:hypothetical protein ASA1KI_02250 [Opitutales bacterium ASA1]|uniref:hypothetical protein n=1 Tax=Congregicoccus parvus TaxID=3081749 RepID=UPI002B317AD9|nr:hypothetical protein ASA1KI_02250 [Opitutales bacterium ASA1]
MTIPRSLRRLLLLAVLCPGTASARDAQQLEEYLATQEVALSGINKSIVGYYIVMAEPTTGLELIDYIENRAPHTPYRDRPFTALRAIVSVEPEAVPFPRLRRLVELIERRWDPADEPSFWELERIYRVVSSYASREAIEFIRNRTDAAFWHGREVPATRQSYSDGPEWIETARSTAIRSLGASHSPLALELLLELKQHPDIAADDVLSGAVESGLELHPMFVADQRDDMRWLELRRNGFRVSEDGYFVPLEDSAEAPKATPPLVARPEESSAPIAAAAAHTGASAENADTDARAPRLPLAVSAVLALAAIAWLALRRRST